MQRHSTSHKKNSWDVGRTFKSQPPVILDIEPWIRHGGRTESLSGRDVIEGSSCCLTEASEECEEIGEERRNGVCWGISGLLLSGLVIKLCVCAVATGGCDCEEDPREQFGKNMMEECSRKVMPEVQKGFLLLSPLLSRKVLTFLFLSRRDVVDMGNSRRIKLWAASLK
ncbi:hypothetical protein BDV19DRAFT_209992 [Aspergillus venezuelensis]